MEKEKIYELLESINNNEERDYNILVSIKDYPKYVSLGRNQKESLQILIMCYVDNPTLKELHTWNEFDLINYIRETDDEEYINADMEIIDKCREIIKEKSPYLNKKQVYNEFDKVWGLNENTTRKEIETYYKEITGLNDKTTLGEIKKYYKEITGLENLSIGNKIDYLYNYVLESMLRDNAITEELYEEISNELKGEY